MKKLRSILILVLGILLGIVAYHYLLMPGDGLNFNGQNASWIKDSTKTKVIIGPNYFFAARTDVKPVAILGAVPSSDVITAVRYLKAYSDTCTSFNRNKTFFVDLSRDQIFTYFGNVERLTTTAAFRVYFGLYPNAHATYPSRLSAYVVAKGTDNKEKYLDGQSGFEIINLGTLCPSDCPSMAMDVEAIYNRAGRPN